MLYLGSYVISIAILLEISYYNRDYDEILVLLNSIDDNLFDPKELPIPAAFISEIAFEARAAEFGREFFSLINGCSDLSFRCPAFFSKVLPFFPDVFFEVCFSLNLNG